MVMILGRKQLEDFVKLLYSKIGEAGEVTESIYENVEDIPLKKIDLLVNIFSLYTSEMGNNDFNAPGHQAVRKLIGSYTSEYLFALVDVMNRENLDHPVYEHLFHIALLRQYLDEDPLIANACELPLEKLRKSHLKLVPTESKDNNEN